ncbi:tether containing UBX domain for GLUT4 [Anopheles nili]|uniref:tether containing UBX domain for GLUT4 n=1 Tax=Anopheles nili TaxID=185578 RepID=UPI00237BD6C2|nr:tether containing UBX domain for GLUT4 [Anopheles nili]
MAKRSVTVLTTHGRRQVVKVEPDMTVLQILETVCQKYNFPHEEYDLLHHNKVLDLSAMFRFSGLPNNAQLEMAKAKRVRKEEDIIIQLQLEDGTRTSNGTFQSSHTLHDVLLSLCPDRAVPEAHPVLVYMRREVYWEQLASTTLRSLGLTRGRAALRLLRRRSEDPKTQANVSAPLPQPLRDVDKKSDGTTVPLTTNVPSVTTPVVIPPAKESDRSEEQKAIEEDRPVPVTEQPTVVKEPEPLPSTSASVSLQEQQKIAAQINILGDRDAVLYHASTAERDHREVNDSFFELTVPEIAQLYKQLQDRVKAYEDAPLLTAELRELERNTQLLSSMNRFRQAVIRILFPDRHILQGVFQVFEHVSHVEEFVRGFLTDPAQPFYLYLTPPKLVLQPSVLLVDAGCFPQVLLHFSSEQSSSEGTMPPASGYLRAELLERLSNAAGAAVLASRAKRNNAATAGQEEPVGSDQLSEEASESIPLPAASVSFDAAIAGPSNRIPNRNFRQSTTVSPSNERAAKILKFLRK